MAELDHLEASSLCSRSTLHAALPTMVLRFLLALALMLSTASALVVGSPRVVTRSGAASLSMGIAAFRTGDKVQVITGADKGAVGKVRAATQLLARPAAALRARARPARNVQGLGRPPPRRSSVSTARRAR